MFRFVLLIILRLYDYELRVKSLVFFLSKLFDYETEYEKKIPKESESK